MQRWGLVLASILLVGGSLGVTAQSTQGACPASQFTVWGANGVVTPGDANNLRSEPSASAERIGRIAPGEPFNVLYGSPTCADGYLWVEIRTATLQGWTVEIPADGDEPFIIPYVAEERETGVVLDDGSILVEENGISFRVPAGLHATSVTMKPAVGLFGNVMSAQPSSVTFTVAGEHVAASLAVYPYGIFDSAYASIGNPELETLLAEQPPLLEYAARNRMPQTPIGGVAALFGGAGAYVPFASGNGLRYLTYFAQDWVLFTDEMSYDYLYRGITGDDLFFVAGKASPVSIPQGTIPANGSRTDEVYPRYLRQFEQNLAAQPTNAFTPDLALIDMLFASLTFSDADALLDLIP